MKLAKTFNIITTSDTAKDFHQYTRIAFLTKNTYARNYLQHLHSQNKKITKEELQELVSEVNFLSDQTLSIKIFKLIGREALKFFNYKIYDTSAIVNPELITVDVSEEEYQNLMLNETQALSYKNKYWFAIKTMLQSCAGSFLSNLTSQMDPDLATKISSMLNKTQPIDKETVDEFSNELYNQLSEEFNNNLIEKLQPTEMFLENQINNNQKQNSEKMYEISDDDYIDNNINENINLTETNMVNVTENMPENKSDFAEKSINLEKQSYNNKGECEYLPDYSDSDSDESSIFNDDQDQFTTNYKKRKNSDPEMHGNSKKIKINFESKAIEENEISEFSDILTKKQESYEILTKNEKSSDILINDTKEESNEINEANSKNNELAFNIATKKDDSEIHESKDSGKGSLGNVNDKKIKIKSLSNIFPIENTKINVNNTVEKIYNTILENKPQQPVTLNVAKYIDEF